MDLALNNLQRLICHKTQQTNIKPTSNIEEANIILMAQISDQPVDTNTLVGETLGCMVLDSGTTSTVSGLNRYNCFLDTLPDSVRNNLKVTKGSKVLKFGSGNKLASVKRVVLPCIVAGFCVDINADIVDDDISYEKGKGKPELRQGYN